MRSAALDGATASSSTYDLRVPDVLRADATTLQVDLTDVHLAVELRDIVAWPLRLGGGGVFSVLPFLGQ